MQSAAFRHWGNCGKRYECIFIVTITRTVNVYRARCVDALFETNMTSQMARETQRPYNIYNIEMVGCALRRRHVHRWYEAHDIALRKRVRRLAANLNRISEDIQPVRRISIWMVLQQTVCHRNTSIRKSNAWGNYKYARTKWPLKKYRQKWRRSRHIHYAHFGDMILNWRRMCFMAARSHSLSPPFVALFAANFYYRTP